MGYYRKPKRETILKNRQFYKDNYKQEIKWLNENVEPLTKGTRSTSVGDMVLIGTTKYKCEPMGWSKV